MSDRLLCRALAFLCSHAHGISHVKVVGDQFA